MSARGKVCTVTDLQKSDKYQRALSLNFDCGSDTLRKLIEKILDDKGKTFKQHVKDPNIQGEIKRLKQKHFLYTEQVKMINSKDPDIECMDITLLTVILLALFPVTPAQKLSIQKLRRKRNELAHKPRSMLEDDIPFNEASQLIIDLAKDISCEFEEEIGKRIEELKKRELIRTRSNMEVIQLNNESLMVNLVEAGKNENVDGNNEIWIKLGLTKYVRQLARFLEVDVLLQDLKEQGVVNDTRKRTIEQTYNYEEQMQLLVLDMMDETRENLLKFCDCVRRKNSLLADLVLHQSSDEREIGTKLQEEEKSRLDDIIKDSFVPNKNKSIACEDVHIFVEAQRKCPAAFQIVQECILECFPDVKFEENDNAEEVLTDMPCDKFGTYLKTKLERVKEGIGCYFENTACEECISAEIFSKLTDAQMEQLFSQKLKEAGLNFGFGIRSSLSELQKKIKRQLNRTSTEKKAVLRKFDSPTETVSYTRSTVKPSSGNLLTPAHVFVCPARQKQCSTSFMAKEVIRFALACINGKKNGTIHLGIKEAGNGFGDVVGLSKDKFSNAKQLDDEIHSCVRICCDKKNRSVVERCIRPVQVVPVEDDFVVLEVDIVPFSGHIKDPCIQIKYPPKGFQRQKCFFFKENMIHTIEHSKLHIDSVSKDFEQLLLERIHLEKDLLSPNNENTLKNAHKLKKLLTGGNKYVTDAFVPIICLGDMSACTNEAKICENVLAMATAFTSAVAVFDFNSTIELRNGVEKGNTYFRVKMAEDYSTKRPRRESDISGDCSIWLYSNGNEELGKDKMTSELWYANRLGGVKNALQQLRQEIPLTRGLIIFMVFQKPVEYDPMLEIARETFLTTFKDECIVIAENEDTLLEWKKEMKGKLSKKDFEDKIVAGLTWEEVAVTVQSVFKPHKDVLYSFPDSRGHIIEMTSREMEEMQLHDIELVDGNAEEHCRLQEEEETDESCRIKRSEEQERFYKGNNVTWWNFYYSTQVGRRDAYDLHKENIKHKLSFKGSRDRYETHNVEHNPGAGGTTVAFHLLWHFSQVRRTPEKAYRCCIVQNITDRTADEVYRFQEFKEKDMSEAKPVIVLVDNKSEEHVNILKNRVDELAYKKGSPGKLFCLLLFVTRVPVSHTSRDVIVEHHLSKREKMWFDKKFNELESNCNEQVNTLIAFNVMRHSFDRKYIEETTQQLINETKDQETKLLGYLSVISSFDSDSPVPETVFDSMMLGTVYDPNNLTLIECLDKPFGIVWSEKQRRNMQKIERETWNVNLSDAMQLLITHRRINRDHYSFNGVCLLSQPLAKAVMKYIMQKQRKTLQIMINDLLELVAQHSGETNQMSKHFVRIVCSLFTFRESYTDEKGEPKVVKFSPLILQLEEQLETESVEDAHDRVVDVINKCFKTTSNAMVGQQLARYYIHIKDYQSAQETVQRCLIQRPHNSYLLDTYGQIYKTKMELHFAGKSDRKMKNADAAECIDLAFRAVEKFKLAQEASTVNEDNASLNSNSFYMEVTTALCLLENFSKFECFEKKTFWEFLNEREFCVETSTYKEIMQMTSTLEQFRTGNDIQQHVETSLRTLEERAYMTRHITEVSTPSKDVLLLRPREKFEMYYGSKEHTSQFEFLYGVGLKLLMNAYNTKEIRPKLEKRVEEAEYRLQSGDTVEIERDLMVYIGYNIIAISKQDFEPNLYLYRALVNYSAKLYDIQQKKSAKERRYVEAYLYYALLHWILPGRAASGLENLSHPNIYKTLLKEWESVFMQNNYIKSADQLSKVKPKIYFALGRGNPGSDILDLECLRILWRKAMQRQGRTMKEVKTDNPWLHPIFEDRLERLSGTVESDGKSICTEVHYSQKDYTFKIRTLENFAQLSNRAVTFVLGFSWMSPVALDVWRTDKTYRRQISQSSPSITREPLQYRQQKSAEPLQPVNRNQSEKDTILPVTDVKKTVDATASFRERKHTHGDMVSRVAEQTKGDETPSVVSERKKNVDLAPATTKPKGNVATGPSDHARKGETDSQGTDRNRRPLKDSVGRGMGRGRGRGRGRGNEDININQRSQNMPHVGKLKGNVCQSVSPEISVVGQTAQPHQTQESAACSNIKEALTREVLSSSNGADLTSQPLTADDNEERSDDWQKVRSRKRQSVGKKDLPKERTTEPGPMRMATPKEKFEELITRCTKSYPYATRDKIIVAYNRLKTNHAGSLKGCSVEYIIEEIGKQL